jgi:hypothetical protein
MNAPAWFDLPKSLDVEIVSCVAARDFFTLDVWGCQENRYYRARLEMELWGGISLLTASAC